MQYLTILAGHNFRPTEAKAALAFMEPGSKLRLQREPDNVHDSSAIQIIDEGTGEFIGYVASADNKDLAIILDAIEGGPSSDAYTYGLVAEGYTPTVDRCEILDFVNGPKKPTIVIEVSTGYELGTVVRGPDEDGDGDADALPR